MKPSAFIFDLENTLLENEHFLRIKEVNFIERLGIRKNTNLLKKLFQSTGLHFWQQLAREQKLPLDPESYMHIFQEKSKQFIKDLDIQISSEGVELLKALIKDNLKIIITSYSKKDRIEYFLDAAKINIKKDLISLIDGEKFDTPKSNNKFYFDLAEYCHLDLYSTITVDSSIENIMAAKKSGITGIFLNKFQYPISNKEKYMQVRHLSEIIPEAIELFSETGIYS
ncbi:MAG: HAD hydrolase-like protein [Bacteroidales bacterium]